MSRDNTLTTEECFEALHDGYILENEHGYKVWLKKNRQFITNINRIRRRRCSFAYKFDYDTWRISGRLPLINRVINKIYYIKNMFGKGL